MGKTDENETVTHSFAYEKSADRLIGLISSEYNHVEISHPGCLSMGEKAASLEDTVQPRKIFCIRTSFC